MPRTYQIKSCSIIGAILCILIQLPSSSTAQDTFPTQGEDYYILDYYLNYTPPPIDEVKENVESHTTQSQVTNVTTQFRQAVRMTFHAPPPPPRAPLPGPAPQPPSRLGPLPPSPPPTNVPIPGPTPPGPKPGGGPQPPGALPGGGNQPGGGNLPGGGNQPDGEHPHGTPGAPNQEPDAGWLDYLFVNFGYNQARVNDEILQGYGYDRNWSLALQKPITSDMSVGVTYSFNRYHIGGIGAYLQHTHSLDFMGIYALNRNFGLGMFINTSWTDIEDEYRFNPQTLQTENIADRYGAWGAGLLFSANFALRDSTLLGITTSLASMNKSSLAHVGNNRDMAWLTSFDLTQEITQDLSFTAYSTLYYLVDRDEDQPDGSFAIIGGEIQYRLSARWRLSAGYETTAGDNDRDERRYLLNLSTTF